LNLTKTVLITGGSKGIGKRTAIAFAKKNFNIIINYRSNKQEAELFVATLKHQYDIQASAIKADISLPDECTELVEKSIQLFGKVDVLVHNAGPYVKDRKKFDDYLPDEWNYMINGNLNSVFYLSRLLVPYMREKQWGRIITTGFDRVETAPGWIYRSAFAAAKSGLASFTKTLALEEASNGITANMVCPGDIVGDWKESSIETAQKERDNSNPVGRSGTGEDLARVITFLASEESDFITGAVIPVTGGKDVLGKVFHQSSK
jgi:3-oxoacyl-[acyl-carrier protein] reductase